jgi:hypothetical protein
MRKTRKKSCYSQFRLGERTHEQCVLVCSCDLRNGFPRRLHNGTCFSRCRAHRRARAAAQSFKSARRSNMQAARRNRRRGGRRLKR